MRAYIHTNVKPGTLLEYKTGQIHAVLESGARVNVIVTPEGKLARPLKLNKKQRRRLKREELAPTV